MLTACVSARQTCACVAKDVHTAQAGLPAFAEAMATPVPHFVRLRAHARQVAEDLQGVRREVHALQQHREGWAEGKVSGTRTPGIRRTAVLLYALHEYRSDCAVAWLEWQHEKRRLVVPEREVLHRMVEGWVLECDAEALGADLAERHPDHRSRLGQARAFYRDWRSAEWVASVNTDKGVAPPTRGVVDARDPGTSPSPADRWARRPGLQQLAASERAWACRWRKRVGGYMCRPRTHEVLPLEDMKEKAAGKTGFRIHFFLVRGSTFGHRF